MTDSFLFISVYFRVENQFTMEKTPTILKSRQSLRTPKTASTKLNGTPKMDGDEIGSGKRLSLRRVKFDMSTSVSPKLASFATPGRTTRSMLKITSNDLPSYVTPLKSSQRKTIAKINESESSDAFVRPLPPKSKRLDKVQADEPIADESSTIADESTEVPSTNEVKIGRKRGRNTATNGAISEMSNGQSEVAVEKRTNRRTKRAKERVGAESSEEDWPSVSILGSSETSTGQFVRSRKSLQEDGDAMQSNVEDFASVSQLGLNTTGKFVRSRKSKHDFGDNVALMTSDEDEPLPSVSFLGARATPIAKSSQRRKTILNVEPTVSNEKVSVTVSETVEESDAKPMPNNKRTSLSARKRKSIQGAEVAVDANASTDRPKSSRMSGQFVRSRKSGPSDIENEMIMDTEDGVTTDQKPNDQESANGSANIDANDEVGAVEDGQKNDNVPSIVVTVDNTEAVRDEVNGVEEDSKGNIQKELKNSRVSVIDLTDSPMVAANKSVLNETFSADEVEENEGKGEEKKEDAEEKDRTFTEENNKTAVNDKTFSPIPTSEKKVVKKAAVATPAPKKGRASLNAMAKSTGKKKSPVLKRLQSTPYLKPKTRNNLAEPAKLSSAKKAKVVEAAIELVAPLKRKSMDKLKLPKVAIQSPKLFKFGEENNQSDVFRFSMCATHLTNKLETGECV